MIQYPIPLKNFVEKMFLRRFLMFLTYLKSTVKINFETFVDL